MGGAYVSFHSAPLISRIGPVLGWSMPGVIPRVRVLHDPEAVRCWLHFIFSVSAKGDCYITAGTTRLSTQARTSPIQTCHLQTQSLPFDREPPASDGNLMTIRNRHLKTQKKLEPRIIESWKELRRMVRDYRRTTWSEYVTELDCRPQWTHTL